MSKKLMQNILLLHTKKMEKMFKSSSYLAEQREPLPLRKLKRFIEHKREGSVMDRKKMIETIEKKLEVKVEKVLEVKQDGKEVIADTRT